MSALEMDPQIRASWVTALRSGKYRQTIGCLRDDYGCDGLGVLCELAVQNGVIPPGVPGSGAWKYGRTGEDWTLPPEVQDWAGLPAADPLVLTDPGDGRRPIGLSGLTDDYEWTFAQIADAIEGGAS
jgi:hypothetical protein